MPRKSGKSKTAVDADGQDHVMVRGLKLPAAAINSISIEKSRRGRGKQKAPTKTSITIRLDPEIVEHFRAGGQGWQSRINGILKRAVKREQRARI